ncbi:hypothetical protein [Massilia eburnea]|uniref:hypothetical protein n=1 Tax=Massilia eburnea TaxID=1776165 RepID=UPI003D6B12DD
MWQKYFIGMIAAGSTASALAQAPLTVAWRDKPPYYYLDENKVAKGFMLDRARQVFAAAGVPAVFVNEPQKRIWANFSHGTPNYCSISWYLRLPEREAVAQFSVPAACGLAACRAGQCRPWRPASGRTRT